MGKIETVKVAQALIVQKPWMVKINSILSDAFTFFFFSFLFHSMVGLPEGLRSLDKLRIRYMVTLLLWLDRLAFPSILKNCYVLFVLAFSAVAQKQSLLWK